MPNNLDRVQRHVDIRAEFDLPERTWSRIWNLCAKAHAKRCCDVCNHEAGACTVCGVAAILCPQGPRSELRIIRRHRGCDYLVSPITPDDATACNRRKPRRAYFCTMRPGHGMDHIATCRVDPAAGPAPGEPIYARWP